MCCRNVAKELEDGIKFLKQRLEEKDTFHEELEEACKETSMCYERENFKLNKEKVMRKKMQFCAE